MGQALDRDGNVLGEAFGETKREVFDKLMERHPDLDEIRIKTLREKAEFLSGASTPSEQNRAGLPARDRMEQFFEFAHLPAHLQAVSKPFSELAAHIIATVPSNPERTVALRKLLEAKDCAVRALLYK